MKRKAYPLIEMLIVVSILSIMAATITLSVHSTEQTAKNEAERLASFLNKQMSKADRFHKDFKLETSLTTPINTINVCWIIYSGDEEVIDEISTFTLAKSFVFSDQLDTLKYKSNYNKYEIDEVGGGLHLQSQNKIITSIS